MKAQKGSRNYCFFDLGARLGVVGQGYAPATLALWKRSGNIVQEAGCAPGPVWMGAENLVSIGIRSLDRPSRGESLYCLSCFSALIYL